MFFTKNMKKKQIFGIFAVIVCFNVNIFCEKQELSELNNELLGIWENSARFIEFTNDNMQNLKMRIVLKPYYRFVYDDVSEISLDYEKVENSDSQFYIKFQYTLRGNSAVVPVCVENNSLFTSFYKRIKYTENNSTPNYNKDGKTSLEGFWVEQGHRDGILLYPNKIPESIDAYFFTGNSYIKFRYWLDDLVYNTKKAVVKIKSGKSYEFPKLLKRGSFVYSCITGNGSRLRNFETGIYSIKQNENQTLSLSFEKQGAGFGSEAVADTYPHKQFIVMKNLPLSILDNNQVFAIGDAYLLRSSVKDLDAEVKKHNAKRRKQ